MLAKGVLVRVSVFLLFLFFFAPAAYSCELGIYTYDSISGKGGLGAKIFPKFEKLTGCKIHVLASGDAVQVLSRVEIDEKRKHLEGDVILGIDTLLWQRAALVADASNILAPGDLKTIIASLHSALKQYPGMVPYDYGALCLIADQEQLEKSGLHAPTSLEDLSRPEWRKNFILEDPRTSSPGLQFLLFTKLIYGEKFGDYWNKIKSHWLAMPEGWDAAYGLFLKGQAPLVWSYVTSEAYHRSEGSTRYHAILFKEGQPLQIEGAVMVRDAPHPEAAGKFLRFLLTDEVQSEIAATNWMFPVSSNVRLPKSFEGLPQSKKMTVLSGSDASEVLREWSRTIH
jgi:thiamine transport system substrate-binding protein